MSALHLLTPPAHQPSSANLLDACIEDGKLYLYKADKTVLCVPFSTPPTIECEEVAQGIKITTTDAMGNQSEKLVLHGKDGTNGIDGIDGNDGADGADGDAGIPGSSPVIQCEDLANGAGYLLKITNPGDDEATCKAITNGKDGTDGIDGEDGEDGDDGKSATIECEELTNGAGVQLTINNPNSVPITKVITNGKDGVNGTDGTDGTDGADGVDGKAATIECESLTNGAGVQLTINNPDTAPITKVITNGTDGVDGTDGTDGSDGTDGFSPVVECNQLPNAAGIEIKITNQPGSNPICKTVLNGTDGIDGKDGTDGVDGTDGEDGADGVSATIACTNLPNNAGYTLTIQNPGQPAISKGVLNGIDGTNGTDGADGADGQNATIECEELPDGSGQMLTINSPGSPPVSKLVKNGADGADGINGTNGTNGVDGTDGTDGTDGVSPTIECVDLPNGAGYTLTIDSPGSTPVSKDVLNGIDGDGVAGTISCTDLPNGAGYLLTINNPGDAPVTKAITNGINGIDGSDGSDGTDGTDGASATIDCIDLPDGAGYTLTINNPGQGTQSKDVLNGVDGDGSGGAVTIRCENADGSIDQIYNAGEGADVVTLPFKSKDIYWTDPLGEVKLIEPEDDGSCIIPNQSARIVSDGDQLTIPSV